MLAGPPVTGSRLGRYEVLSHAGSGGTSDVYCARDTHLDRLVALKIVGRGQPDEARTRARFLREVQAISRLTHPNICRLYDVGHHDGLDFLVMEYLAGQTLSDRLRNGPMPIDDVLRYGIELAGALGYAHRNGLTHRDVKPSNILLTEHGARVLDFGLARSGAASFVGEGDAIDETLTGEGVIIGTVQYMAPEQLEGLPADPRSDIFSLGLVLYEMVTGRKAFGGRSAATVIAATLSAAPAPIALPDASLSRMLEHVTDKCLEKNPDGRWQNAGDVKTELEWIRDTLHRPTQPATHGLHRVLGSGSQMVWTGATLAAAMTVALFVRTDGAGALTPQTQPSIQFSLAPPPANSDLYFGLESSLSPDGRHFVSTSLLPGGRRPLWLQSLGPEEGHELPGTDGAHYPFWSSDGRSVAFFSDGLLKSVDIRGGTPATIGEAPTVGPAGGTWTDDGRIIIGSDHTGLFQLSVKSGPTLPLSTLGRDAGEIGHTLPHFLPDGRHFLFLLRSTQPEVAGIYVSSVDTPRHRTRVLDVQSEAIYAQGYLVFSDRRTLFAQPFDPVATRTIGPRIRIAPVAYNASGGRTGFSLSTNGVVAYQSSPARALTWVDRTGRRLMTIPGDYEDPAISADDRRIAASRLDPGTGERRIWISDTERGSNLMRATKADRGNELAPVWSPDGRRLMFASDRDGRFDLRWVALETGAEAIALKSAADKWPLDYARDGRFVLFRGNGTSGQLWRLTPGDDPAATLVMETLPAIAFGRLSPEGRWLAYVASQSGTSNVFVKPVSGPEAPIQVSVGGGAEPRWSGDGKELFYLTRTGTMMAVPVVASDSMRFGPPVPLFESRAQGSTFIGSSTRNQYDVISTGQKFLLSEPEFPLSATPMRVIVNWQAALREP